MILGGGGVTVTASCSVLEVGEAVLEVRKAVSVIASNASMINSLMSLLPNLLFIGVDRPFNLFRADLIPPANTA